MKSEQAFATDRNPGSLLRETGEPYRLEVDRERDKAAALNER